MVIYIIIIKKVSEISCPIFVRHNLSKKLEREPANQSNITISSSHFVIRHALNWKKILTEKLERHVYSLVLSANA